jgi:hypothetical protein
MSLSNLQKMTLTAYQDNTFDETKKVAVDPYTVLINPDTYNLTYGLHINDRSAQGTSVPIVSYNKGHLQMLSFKFLFDGTGVIKKTDGDMLSGLASGIAIPGIDAKTLDVATELSKFKKVVYDYQGKSHKPPYVKIQWGVLSFNAVLQRMNVTFKLFKPDGSPLRAEADCTFLGVIDEKKLAGLERRQSPDITHIRTVKEGDTLSLMCYREYGDSKYYYQVAKFNGLLDFKVLTPGTQLVFPPVINN